MLPSLVFCVYAGAVTPGPHTLIAKCFTESSVFMTFLLPLLSFLLPWLLLGSTLLLHSLYLLKGSLVAASQSKSCKPATEASPWSAPTPISNQILHLCSLPSAMGAIPKLLGSPKSFPSLMHDGFQSILRMFLLLPSQSPLIITVPWLFCDEKIQPKGQRPRLVHFCPPFTSTEKMIIKDLWINKWTN